MGGIHPSSSTLYEQLSQIVKDYIKKIPIFPAFFKLLLGHVKVELMLILWYFWVVLWMRPHPPTDRHPHFLVKEGY